MARWEPDAPGRLAVAALDLFAERGYEATTVIQIAERAGLTKSTFFRHFPDKREVLFGGTTMAGRLTDEIVGAPAEATPLEVLAQAMDAIGREIFTSDRRELSARRRAVIAANPELREREALKGLGLTAAMSDSLKRRGVPELTARAAAELGALAFEIAYDRWSSATGGDDFAAVARKALGEVRAATELC
ncbi:TetR/AcrR family transcriptional regulator [Amycolatopsis saalfeldensis]|uniref:DNA-binding transcriptional regulator, AcrR family n=1 Tax=Amycolatopsis saalfeldensis TaxID=394193 RepID=A0A1H8RNC4_9PSEU|nr:TetR/AcrR family transcriptional regulator [Amycolatopsis saalfeldensis]SEO67787.1 DNA-binding transcriptional regulator, AcrR family [Amycolatopsis saalfeldensis]